MHVEAEFDVECPPQSLCLSLSLEPVWVDCTAYPESRTVVGSLQPTWKRVPHTCTVSPPLTPAPCSALSSFSFGMFPHLSPW